MATQSDAVLIGLIITIAIVGIGGGVSLTVFILIKWREYVKRRSISRTVHPRSRQPTRRRRIRVRHAENAVNNSGTAEIELPPPYSEHDTHAPPTYASLGLMPSNFRRENSTRGTRGTNGGPLTPAPMRRDSVSRTLHLTASSLMVPGTGSTNTPSGSMFTTSIGGTREQSASSNIRSMNMVHLNTRN